MTERSKKILTAIESIAVLIGSILVLLFAEPF